MSLFFQAMIRLLAGQQPEMLPVDGARLQRIGAECWAADRELSYGRGNALPVRMVVTRNGQGELTLYSPVALDDGTLEALAGLGEVVRVVAPNRFHTLFAGRALDCYPAAELVVPVTDAGLAERFPHRARVVRSLTRLEPGLEVLPVQLREGLEELCVFHDQSESLLLADLLFNMQQANSRMARLAYRANGIWRRPANSRLQRLFLLRDRQSLGEFYRWALAKPFSQIVMAHGQIVTRDAREQFYQVFSRYGGVGR